MISASVRHYCDRIAVMRDGKLIERAKSRSFLREPSNPIPPNWSRPPAPADVKEASRSKDTRNFSTCAI